MTSDDDRDALAAEYVLGTLDADERVRVESMMSADVTFTVLVRRWERRLGELHGMVEAVEPPAQVWDKIKADIGEAPEGAISQLESDGSLSAPPAPATVVVDDKPASDEATGDEPAFDKLVLDREAAEELQSDEPVPHDKPVFATPGPDKAAPSMPAPDVPSAQVVQLNRRLKQWRGFAAALGTLAAALVFFMVLRELAPVLFPAPKPKPVKVEKKPTGRWVAMLQKEPSAPAFLLTVDLDTKTLIVRRVAAEPRNDKSYELWLVSKRFTGPRSLGLVGAGEFTRRTTLAAYDPRVINEATYAISLEPQGGSPTGAPTGPVLFTGKLIEATPPDIPPPGG